jgi:hypothetical protein
MINPMAFITPWATLALTTCESTDISDEKFKPAPAGDVLPVFELSGPQTGSFRKISALLEQAFFRYAGRGRHCDHHVIQCVLSGVP